MFWYINVAERSGYRRKRILYMHVNGLMLSKCVDLLLLGISKLLYKYTQIDSNMPIVLLSTTCNKQSTVIVPGTVVVAGKVLGTEDGFNVSLGVNISVARRSA